MQYSSVRAPHDFSDVERYRARRVRRRLYRSVFSMALSYGVGSFALPATVPRFSFLPKPSAAESVDPLEAFPRDMINERHSKNFEDCLTNPGTWEKDGLFWKLDKRPVCAHNG